jgi:phosphopantetheinyl transferase
MVFISPSDCIRCYFDPGSDNKSDSGSHDLKVYFAETKDLNRNYSDLRSYITPEEDLRAGKFLFDSDRETYISSHSVLRLILAKELNTNPSEISVISGKNGKPGLAGNPAFFNLSHTREAFAIVISRDNYVGIDLEMINSGMDIYSIIKTFFSTREGEFILHSEHDAINRFFLLWTRKEALLKAIGTGIINELPMIEVSEQENLVFRSSFENAFIDYASSEHFIYSEKLLDNYISIATPRKAAISINHLSSENIISYLV